MHITVLTHNHPRFTGDFSGTFIEALCQELVRQGQHVTVWAPYDPKYEIRDTKYELRLYRYVWPERWHRLGYMRSMQSDLALRMEAYALSPLMFALGIAHVLRHAKRDRPDLLHAHWLLPNGFIAAIVSRRLGIPLVVSIPGSDAQVANANPLFRAMARFTLRQASLLTANSVELRDAVVNLTQRDNGAKEEMLRKFDLIIYGTDPEVLKPDETGVETLRAELCSQQPTANNPGLRQDGTVSVAERVEANRNRSVLPKSYNQQSTINDLSPDTRPSPLLLLCVGRMVAKKGFDVLLRALAEPSLRQRNVVAVMVGKGDEWEAWQQLARALGVADRVRWVGVIPKTEIGRYYNACDMLIMPSVSRPADGLNVCVLDAMSCAKSVVASNVAGNPLAVADGETGLIVPEQEAAALAAAIARLVDDPVLRAKMGRAGRRRIEQELGWPPLAKRYIQHFERLRLR